MQALYVQDYVIDNFYFNERIVLLKTFNFLQINISNMKQKQKANYTIKAIHRSIQVIELTSIIIVIVEITSYSLSFNLRN